MLFTGAAIGFGLALLALVGLMALILFGGAAGATSVQSIGGMGGGSDPELLRIAAGLDTLLPIGYATGLGLMAFGLSPDAKGALVAALVVLGLLADMIENGMVLAQLPLVELASLAKFGFLTCAGFVLVTLIPGQDWLTRVAKALGWGGVPLAVAAIVAEVAVAQDSLGFVLGLTVLFAVLLRLCLRYRA